MTEQELVVAYLAATLMIVLGIYGVLGISLLAFPRFVERYGKPAKRLAWVLLWLAVAALAFFAARLLFFLFASILVVGFLYQAWRNRLITNRTLGGNGSHLMRWEGRAIRAGRLFGRIFVGAIGITALYLALLVVCAFLGFTELAGILALPMKAIFPK